MLHLFNTISTVLLYILTQIELILKAVFGVIILTFFVLAVVISISVVAAIINQVEKNIQERSDKAELGRKHVAIEVTARQEKEQ